MVLGFGFNGRGVVLCCDVMGSRGMNDYMISYLDYYSIL